MKKNCKKIKVLHCLNSMNVGGIESWLKQLVEIKDEGTQFDFFLTVTNGFYDKTLINNGCKLYKSPPLRHLRKYKEQLKELLTKNNYDALHVHGSEFLGDLMKVASDAGIKVRVSHCHNTVLARGKKGFLMELRKFRKRYYERGLISKYSTNILACGNDAGRFLLGDDWATSKKTQILYCGVNTEKFIEIESDKSKTDKLRKHYNIDKGTLVIGHVGSMGSTNQKNHPFILKVFRKVLDIKPSAVLFLAGDGPSKPLIEKLVSDYQMTDNVIIPGIVSDVPSVMTHLFDVNFLPSLWEGLPVAGLEATAAGLVTVCSNKVTEEFTHVFKSRVKILPLEADLNEWAMLLLKQSDNKIKVAEGGDLLNSLGFSINSSLLGLENIYRQGY